MIFDGIQSCTCSLARAGWLAGMCTLFFLVVWKYFLKYCCLQRLLVGIYIYIICTDSSRYRVKCLYAFMYAFMCVCLYHFMCVQAYFVLVRVPHMMERTAHPIYPDVDTYAYKCVDRTSTPKRGRTPTHHYYINTATTTNTTANMNTPPHHHQITNTNINTNIITITTTTNTSLSYNNSPIHQHQCTNTYANTATPTPIHQHPHPHQHHHYARPGQPALPTTPSHQHQHHYYARPASTTTHT